MSSKPNGVLWFTSIKLCSPFLPLQATGWFSKQSRIHWLLLTTKANLELSGGCRSYQRTKLCLMVLRGFGASSLAADKCYSVKLALLLSLRQMILELIWFLQVLAILLYQLYLLFFIFGAICFLPSPFTYPRLPILVLFSYLSSFTTPPV